MTSLMDATQGPQGTETAKRAACTINDFTYGREGALSMTLPMDATEEGEQNNLKQNNLKQTNMHES
jgi:hypothetical protein